MVSVVAPCDDTLCILKGSWSDLRHLSARHRVAGLNFDIGNDNAIPINDVEYLYNNNVEYYVDLFINDTMEQLQHYRGNHIMFTMGTYDTIT